MTKTEISPVCGWHAEKGVIGGQGRGGRINRSYRDAYFGISHKRRRSLRLRWDNKEAVQEWMTKRSLMVNKVIRRFCFEKLRC